MPFTQFTTVAEVCQRFGIADRIGSVIAAAPSPPSAAFREQMDFVLERLSLRSESGRLQRLIHPALMEAYRPVAAELTFLAGEPFGQEEPLRGFPDFLVGRRSPLSNDLVEKPTVLIIEAKRDDFDTGWGQCAAAMLAAQQLNGTPDLPIWGIVTNGMGWQFGRLLAATLTRHPGFFSLANLAELLGVLRFVFEECARSVQAATPSPATA